MATIGRFPGDRKSDSLYDVLKARVGNVLDYGAVGDGATDDTVAIQAAIDAAAGGTVIFPDGVYRVTSINVSNNNTTLRSVNKHGATLQCYDGTDDLIDNSGLSIDGLRIEGFIFDQLDSSTNAVIHIGQNSSNIKIIGNKFINCDNWETVGIDTGVLTNFWLQGNEVLGTIRTNVDNFLEASGAYHNFFIQDNYFRNQSLAFSSSSTVDPISTNIQITGNVFDQVENSNLLIRVAGTVGQGYDGVLVSGNLVKESGENYALGAGTWNKFFANIGGPVSGSGARLSNISVVDNIVQEGQLANIGDTTDDVTYNVTVTGNTVSGGRLGRSLVDVERTGLLIVNAKNINVSGNSFRHMGGHTCQFTDCSRIAFSGNTLDKCGWSSGIATVPGHLYLTDVTYMTISGNIFSDYGGGSGNRPSGVHATHNANTHDIVIQGNTFVDTRDDTTAHTNSGITETEISAGTLYSHTVTTSTAHGLEPGDKVTIAGATSATYNAEWLVLEVPSTTTYRFERSGTSIGASTVHGTSTGVVTMLHAVCAGDNGTPATNPYNWMIKDNIIQGIALPFRFEIDDVSYPKGIITQGNLVESSGEIWEEVTGSTISISTFNDYYKTANTGATTVTDIVTTGLPSGNIIPDGRVIYILINDANTTIDFSSNAEMKGNGGVDLSTQGAIIMAVYDKSNDVWNCTVLGT